MRLIGIDMCLGLPNTAVADKWDASRFFASFQRLAEHPGEGDEGSPTHQVSRVTDPTYCLRRRAISTGGISLNFPPHPSGAVCG